MKNKLVLFASILSLTFSGTQGHAQWVLGKGPPTSCQFSCFVISGTNLFAGGVEESGTIAGVFRSTDTGANWAAVSPDFNVDCLAAIGTNLFAGTESVGGLYRSTDNGNNWTSIGWAATDSTDYRINALAVIDANLFAGPVMETTGYTGEDGVYLSTNNGMSWNEVNTGFPYHNGNFNYATRFGVMGTNLFAGTYDPSSSNDSNDGIFLSTDNGTSWTAASGNLPFTGVDGGFAVSGMNLYVINESDDIFLSIDKGADWAAIDTGLQNPLDVTAIAVSGTNIFAGTRYNGVFLSTNNGTSWSNVLSGDSTYFDAIGVAAISVLDTNLFVASEYGIWHCPLSELIPSPSAITPTPSSPPQMQSYPNPFSQSTTVTFSSQSAGYAEVTVVNLLGAQVAELFSGELSAGEHSFSWDASGMSPGMYECIVRMNGQVQRVGMILSN